jgi:DNA-binding NarL/FixJ family response regulator
VTTTVVLVDDVPEVRRLVRTALRFRDGFQVVGEAGDGAEAVRLAITLRPDIMVLDLGLPDIAGRDVLTQVRAHSPSTSIVVFSGAADPPEREWIRERVEAYVLKDDALEYLIDLLTSVRDRSVRAVRDLPRDLLSVREARRFLREVLERWGLSEVEDAAQLVVSELVTNAITHAQSSCQVRLSRSAHAVRVEVVDCGVGTPDPQPDDPAGEHGRGMHIVAVLSLAWGTEVLTPGRKVVWAELPVSA